MAAWQAANALPETGVLTSAQRARLLGGWKAEVAALGLQTVTEDEAGITALTALWHAEESLATFFSRHCKAAAPPGETPAQ